MRGNMYDFPGFERPVGNFYRLPNEWFDLWRAARDGLSQPGSRPRRILAPLKIVEYVIKHTWGWSNFDQPIRLSRSELRRGRHGSKGRRVDQGAGLSSEASITRGISTGLALNMLEQVDQSGSAGDREWCYLPKLGADCEEKECQEQSGTGFRRPEANFFLVPKVWTDLSGDICSEALILGVEYLFRHTWGWQAGQGEVRWLDADEIANGRRYRSLERRGERYDGGIGYTDRQTRDALQEGVKRNLLVWRYRQRGHKEHALRLRWMTDVSADGYFDPDIQEGEPAAGQNGGGREESVWGTEIGVGGGEASVGGMEESVEGTEESVWGTEEGVGGGEETVGGREETVGATEKGVGILYKDTSGKTPTQDTQEQTPTTTHRRRVDRDRQDVGGLAVVDDDQILVFFRPDIGKDELGEPRQLTLDQAGQTILAEKGAWYWSEADLADPDRSQREGYTASEVAAQVALDMCLLGPESAIVDNGITVEVFTLTDIARLLAEPENEWVQPSVYCCLWHLLDLPTPDKARSTSDRRRKRLDQQRAQAEEWGDPDLVSALGGLSISVDDARQLIAGHGEKMVAAWLSALRASCGQPRNPAGVLISNLRAGKTPPGWETETQVISQRDGHR